jgi:hypothetical protein
MSGGPIFSRRRFLRASLVAGGAAVLGAAGLLSLRGRAPRVEGLRSLSPRQYRTLSLLALAAFPEGEGFPGGARDADLARRFDEFLADEPEWNQDDLRTGLTLLELGPLLFERRLTTFGRLAPAERLAHFERWGEGRLVQRQVAMALRKFLSLVFYDRPEAWPAIGYDGPLLGAVGR